MLPWPRTACWALVDSLRVAPSPRSSQSWALSTCTCRKPNLWGGQQSLPVTPGGRGGQGGPQPARPQPDSPGFPCPIANSAAWVRAALPGLPAHCPLSTGPATFLRGFGGPGFPFLLPFPGHLSQRQLWGKAPPFQGWQGMFVTLVVAQASGSFTRHTRHVATWWMGSQVPRS